jgi:hypothetical protein
VLRVVVEGVQYFFSPAEPCLCFDVVGFEPFAGHRLMMACLLPEFLSACAPALFLGSLLSIYSHRRLSMQTRICLAQLALVWVVRKAVFSTLSHQPCGVWCHPWTCVYIHSSSAVRLDVEDQFLPVYHHSHVDST